jgi:hypothetical protein
VPSHSVQAAQHDGLKLGGDPLALLGNGGRGRSGPGLLEAAGSLPEPAGQAGSRADNRASRGRRDNQNDREEDNGVSMRVGGYLRRQHLGTRRSDGSCREARG